ncbi:MAG: dTDP-glucose 4,6-dehydratase [Planctomycetes bacterium]|nr:dTDP-glucose 4,6-dehydratase [Planctomycetota bacterium]
MSRILVTGAAGFIGSNFVRHLLRARSGAQIVGVDKLTYAGNLESLADCTEDARFRFVRCDICDADAMAPILGDGIEAIVNFAAESHVDRSILGAQEFVRTNVIGVQVLLDLARAHEVNRFLQVSTDEVYGSLGPSGKFTESTPVAPNSPYSASKTAADHLVHAYHHTFGMATLITRCSNNYGPYQFPEKLIPLFITNLLEKNKVPLYGDGMNVRDWIHVQDHCEAILTVLERGTPGQVYNIGGECEIPNIEIARRLLGHLDCDEDMIEYVTDRPGHDRRYAVDISKITKELGWRPRMNFDDGLAETVAWYLANRKWWQRIKTGEYQEYYEKQYGRGGVTVKPE